MTTENPLLPAPYDVAWSVGAVIFYLLWAIALWRVFSKAGYAGILALIPIVNVIVLVKIAGYSGWYAVLYLIPIVNIVFPIFVALRLSRAFGHGTLFGILWLWLFQTVGFFIVGLGRAEYRRAR